MNRNALITFLLPLLLLFFKCDDEVDENLPISSVGVLVEPSSLNVLDDPATLVFSVDESLTISSAKFYKVDIETEKDSKGEEVDKTVVTEITSKLTQNVSGNKVSFPFPLYTEILTTTTSVDRAFKDGVLRLKYELTLSDNKMLTGQKSIEVSPALSVKKAPVALVWDRPEAKEGDTLMLSVSTRATVDKVEVKYIVLESGESKTDARPYVGEDTGFTTNILKPLTEPNGELVYPIEGVNASYHGLTGLEIGSTLRWHIAVFSGVKVDSLSLEIPIVSQMTGAVNSNTLSEASLNSHLDLGKNLSQDEDGEIVFVSTGGFEHNISNTDLNSIGFVKLDPTGLSASRLNTIEKYVAEKDLLSIKEQYDLGASATSVSSVKKDDLYLYKAVRRQASDTDITSYGFIVIGNLTSDGTNILSFELRHAEGIIEE